MFNTNAEDSYSYYDAQGRYLTTKHVYHLPDGTLKFTLDNTHSNPKDSFNLKNELLFYHLRNLVNTPKGETIYIVESEKDADTFEQFKMIAVCTYNGAGSGHFPRSVVPYFAGKNVVIFHANNNVSKQFAQEEASLVNPVTTSVKVIDLSEIWEIMPEQATIGDYLQSYGDAGLQQAKHLIENTPIWTAPKARTEAKYLPIRSVKDLMQQHFAPTEFLVNGILPSGLALLASPPKFGKSWFALQLCLAVAKGASFLGLSTTKSDVLYLDLEDGDADLQERIKKLNMGEDAPEGLLYSTEVPTIADGLVDMLHQTLCSNPSIKLVVIDTLGVVLGAQSSDSNSFTQEYALFHGLKKVAADHAIALLVIHHLRKANDENNPFNRIYGSVATQAALDTMMVLEKDTHFSDTAQLHISGRRCAQQEFVLSFDTDSCSWSMVGNADEVDEKFHHAQYERSETVIAIKEAISRGNGTWRGSMSQLSRVAESIPYIGHVFVNLLLTYLVVGNSGGISLKDKIQATNFVQESQGDKGNKQRHASAPNVKLSGADVGLTVDEVKHLSEIIDEVNSRAGKGYDSSAMTKVMLQIKDLLLHSDKLKTAAKNNTEQDFEFSFYDNTDDALIEGLSQNQDFFSLLLSNDDIKHRVLGVFLHEVYKELREQQ